MDFAIGVVLMLLLFAVTLYRAKKEGELLFPMMDREVHYPTGRIVAVVNDEATLAEDDRHLALARRAKDAATSPWAKRHWGIVELQLLKSMKWRATAALSNGSEFRDGVREYALHGKHLRPGV